MNSFQFQYMNCSKLKDEVDSPLQFICSMELYRCVGDCRRPEMADNEGKVMECFVIEPFSSFNGRYYYSTPQ